MWMCTAQRHTRVTRHVHRWCQTRINAQLTPQPYCPPGLQPKHVRHIHAPIINAGCSAAVLCRSASNGAWPRPPALVTALYQCRHEPPASSPILAKGSRSARIHTFAKRWHRPKPLVSSVRSSSGRIPHRHAPQTSALVGAANRHNVSRWHYDWPDATQYPTRRRTLLRERASPACALRERAHCAASIKVGCTCWSARQTW